MQRTKHIILYTKRDRETKYFTNHSSALSLSCITVKPALFVSKHNHYIIYYISVAKPYGRFGQKLESLQAGQERIGQGKIGHGRKVQGRGTEQKRAEQSRAGRGQKAGQGRAGHDQ